MKRLLQFALVAALALAGGSALAAADKPLVMEAGKIKQLPASTTLQINASGTGAASINIPHGTAPTSPNNGDCWTTTTGLFCRVNGSTVGPYATGTGSGSVTTTGSPSTGNLTKFSGTSSVTSGDLTGDVTTSGTLATTIASDAVTYAKIQNVSAASKLVGRGDSGSGDPQEITLGSGLSMSGTTLTATGGGGATTAAALTITSSGGASPGATFDGSVAKTIDYSTVGAAKTGAATGSGLTMATSRLLGRTTASTGAIEEISVGSNLTLSGGSLSASGSVTTTGSPATGNLTKFSGTSSVTSGDLSGDVTTSGTLATTIGSDAVTYAKIQNVSAASKLIGRGDSGSGDPQEITLGSGLSMSGTTLTATGGGGATTAQTLTITSSGGASPGTTFDGSVAKTIDYSTVGAAKTGAATGSGLTMATAKLLGRTTASTGAIEEISAASNLTLSAGSLSATEATAAQVQSATASKLVAADKLIAAAAPQTLTDGATINWDLHSGFNAKVTIAGNRTLATPTNPHEGMTYRLEVIQDGTGSRTVTWPSAFDFGSAGTPTLSTGASKHDFLYLDCYDASTPKFRVAFNKAS